MLNWIINLRETTNKLRKQWKTDETQKKVKKATFIRHICEKKQKLLFFLFEFPKSNFSKELRKSS